MFYSAEILTKRKGGFGVYWLAATVGLKASARKFSRKELLGSKIITPDEPLALRLSSNLLVGVARVFKEQYDAFLREVTNVNVALVRAFAEMHKAASVDLPAHGGHFGGAAAPPGAINLAADPDAVPELGLGAVLNQAWDEGIDWARWDSFGRSAEGSELELSSGVEHSLESSALSGQRRSHEARLEDITLQEPHLGDVAFVEDPYAEQELYFGEDYPFKEGEGLLMDEAELERSMAEGARRSAQLSPRAEEGADLGGEQDVLAGFDFGGEESREERVRREHDEGQAQRKPFKAPSAERERTPESKERTATEVEEEEMPPTKRPRVARKARPVQFDAVITLTDTQLRQMRASYPARMEAERQKLVAAAEEREGRQRALDLAINALDRFTAPAIAAVWRAGYRDPTALVRPKKPAKRKRAGTPTPVAKGEEVEEGRTLEDEPEVSRGEGLGGEDIFFDQPYGGEGVGAEEQLLEEELELGRPGELVGSQRQSLPWNVEAERAPSEAGYAPSLVGSQRVSIADLGSRRPSRAGSAIPSRQGTPAPSLGLGAEHEFTAFEQGEVEALEEKSPSRSQLPSATLERESVNFLNYAKRHVAEGEDELLFSDIVPVAGSSESLAAQALYHTLTLATKKLIKVHQAESFGEIHISFVKE